MYTRIVLNCQVCLGHINNKATKYNRLSSRIDVTYCENEYRTQQHDKKVIGKLKSPNL